MSRSVADRVPLTLAQALAGVRPAPYTAEEWAALHRASEVYADGLPPTFGGAPWQIALRRDYAAVLPDPFD